MATALPHELRTPLAAIQGYAEVLRNDWDELSVSDGRSMLDEIRSATDRLKRLTENYALYVELEAQADGGHEGGPVSVAVVCDAIAEQAAVYERQDDVQLDMEAADLLIEDRHARRIAVELIDNALKFSAAGDRVTVEGRREAGRYRLRVADHGRGMDEDHRHRLEPFVQVDRSTHEQQGVGLGLVLVHRIVQHSGADVQITSEEGEGITVNAVLPAVSSGRGARAA